MYIGNNCDYILEKKSHWVNVEKHSQLVIQWKFLEILFKNGNVKGVDKRKYEYMKLQSDYNQLVYQVIGSIEDMIEIKDTFDK